ncbi:MAG: hypothetical protein L6V78_06275 [Clostridium sp.]|nr:MAG: hypothetical protein L6V78_06275 [Clostridium sp.]
MFLCYYWGLVSVFLILKDYINNNNNSFSIWVRGLLNNFTSDNEPVPSPIAPSDDKNVLSKSSTISYQGIKLTNF